MDRLLVVDGSNLLFQMFFGMPARIVNHRGEAIQGTMGFVGALLKILRRVQPTHAAVVFDGQHANARSTLDADYKANRVDYADVPEAENPYSQLADVCAALDHMGIYHAETTDCEADDWMAACALRWGGAMEVVLSSFDSDLFQLVTPRVSVLRYRGEKTAVYTPEDVERRFGVSPERYADFKALTGDKADHIPGVRRIGPKTAAALIARFGTLEQLLSRAEKIEKSAVRQAVIDAAERLRLNCRLIRLTGDAPLPFDISDLEFVNKGWTTGSVLRAIGLKE